jgi:hypothetical protein
MTSFATLLSRDTRLAALDRSMHRCQANCADNKPVQSWSTKKCGRPERCRVT